MGPKKPEKTSPELESELGYALSGDIEVQEATGDLAKKKSKKATSAQAAHPPPAAEPSAASAPAAAPTALPSFGAADTTKSTADFQEQLDRLVSSAQKTLQRNAPHRSMSLSDYAAIKDQPIRPPPAEKTPAKGRLPKLNKKKRSRPPEGEASIPPGMSLPPPPLSKPASESSEDTSARARRIPPIGSRLGRYHLQGKLGDGSTAVIYLSEHENLAIPVAIKLYQPTGRINISEGIGHFLKEARLLARLDHPNIVRVIDIDCWQPDGSDPPWPFIVFEYVGALSLGEAIEAKGQVAPETLAQVGSEVADALGCAWSEGILHRDVKPNNILIREDRRVKLVDFGVATGVIAGESLVIGSPAYMAPEQVTDPAHADARADMYSLGATLYHAACGQPPFLRDTPKETLRAQIHDAPPPLTKRVPGFPNKLARLIHRLLEKAPAGRYASWPEVAEELAEHAGGHSSSLKRLFGSLLGKEHR